MKNIFNEVDFSEIASRVEKLSDTSLQRWGHMNLQEMLVHCTTQLKLSLGEISARQQGPSIMRSKLGKWLLFSNLPWPKNAGTPNEMNAELSSFSLSEIQNEKRVLLNYLEKVRAETQLKKHPFFGELSRKEWGRLIYKHLDHHLKQFSSR